MGLTTAMYTGLTGMNANQNRIDVIGNNIANVNTTAFKASRALFQFQFSQLLSGGSTPNDTLGGTNPTQIGKGVVLAATQRDMNDGAIETTGITSDLAIQGGGMFIVQKPGGRQAYTRDGSFSVDAQNKLVSVDGYRVQGFGVDEQFNIIPSVLGDITVPLGSSTIANATQNAVMDGDLAANGTLATLGSRTESQALVDGGGAPATASTALADLREATSPAIPLFAADSAITISGLTKGGRSMPSATFTVGLDGATLGDFATWLQGVTGVNTSADAPAGAGVTIDNGVLVVQSNPGADNGIAISSTAVTSNNVSNAVPFTFTQSQEADGSSVFTSFTVYDSLGTPVNVNVTFTLEATPDTGPVWRYYAEQADVNGAGRALGTSTIAFDTNGNFISAAANQFNVDRSGTGAATPMTVALDFSGIHGLSTSVSNVIMAEQDGYPPGTLQAFGVGQDGVITGAYTNGLTRPLGQVALAVFVNPEGLIAERDNLYLAGPNSGAATVTAPGEFGAGQVLGGSLELSNVDLAREFIGLITSSTGFQAASRVISTSNDMLDQLLLVVR